MSNDYDNFDHDGFWAKVRRLAGSLPMVRDVAAAYFAMVDDDTPVWAKVVLAGALAYFVLPVDAIPDVLFPVGYTDDAGVVAGAIAAASTYVLPRHYEEADRWLGRRT